LQLDVGVSATSTLASIRSERDGAVKPDSTAREISDGVIAETRADPRLISLGKIK